MEEDLTTDLMALQSQLEDTLVRVQANSTTLQRFQLFEKELLNLNTLVEMVEYVLTTQDFFDLDYIGICLVDAKGELENYLSEGGFDINNNPKLIIFPDDKLLQAKFGRSVRPYLGAYKTAKCADFFVYGKRKPASVAVVPLLRRGKFLGALSMGSYDPQRFVDSMASDFIEHMCSVVGVCLENHLNLEMINRSSLIDTLTGVNNRHFLEQRLGEEIARAQRSIEPLCCLALDIDDFRQVNVNYGHQVGDQFLIAIAAAIREQLRNNDLLVRYSGEKFIALLTNTEAEQAEEIAQRIRELVKQIQINQIQIDQVVSVTISIGISIYKTSYSSQQKPAKVKVNLLRKAEKALDKAKKDGKDRVVMTDIVTDPMSIANLFKSRSVS